MVAGVTEPCAFGGMDWSRSGLALVERWHARGSGVGEHLLFVQ